MDRLLAKWFIMDVSDIRDHGGFSSLVTIKGNLVKSNFLDTPRLFEIPALRKPTEGIDIGDRVKFTYYTFESNVKSHPDGTLGFADQGLKYEKLVGDSWNLLFEDYPDKG